MESNLSPRQILKDHDLIEVLDAIDVLRLQAGKLLGLQENALQHPDSGDNAPVPSGSATPDEMERQLAMEQTQLFCQAAQLRAIYRRTLMSQRATKETSSNARSDVDDLHLQLQNLIYEKKHLTGEIVSCQEYSHKYTSLPLLPLEEFIALSSDHSTLPEHELMIARIEHELQERQSLEEQRQKLLKQKQGLISENHKRRQDLTNLDNNLEKFIAAAAPIMKTLEKEYN